MPSKRQPFLVALEIWLLISSVFKSFIIMKWSEICYPCQAHDNRQRTPARGAQRNTALIEQALMTLLPPNQHASVRPAVLRANLSASLRCTGWRAILICALCLPASLASQAAESYSTVVSKHLALETEVSVDAGHTGAGAENPAIADLKRAVTDEIEMLPQGKQATLPPKKSQSAAVSAAVSVVLVSTGLLTFGTVGYLFKRRFDSLISAREVAEDRAKLLLAEDPSLAAFFNELRAGLSTPGAPATEATGALNGVELQSQQEDLPAETDPLCEFFAAVPNQLASFRKLFSDISRTSDEAGRQNIILEFLHQASRLKELARPRELRPVWLMACALEGLLKQLTRDASEVTASVLRTVAGAVDLLETLCVRGLNPNLATEPPVNLLAVDDDPISRLAISFALKKAFDTPDLAPSGAAALALAEQQIYDVIFLDVDMPGMDGYELCTKIRQTDRHRTTPIVFVTRYSDFNSRAKSTLSGGESVIAKPFLAFEITVKALTLALRGRLQNGVPAPRAAYQEIAGSPALETTDTANESPAAIAPSVATPAQAELVTRTMQPESREGQSATPTSSVPDDFSFVTLIEASEHGSHEALFTRAPAFLTQLRNQLQAAQLATQAADLQKFLGRLCTGIHAFNTAVERAELRAANRLGSALEGMLKKIREHPQLCSPSALNAASAALELLEALCSQAGTDLDFTRSTVRILVVDDDPIARRAISGSIQLAFGRPDNAEHGNAALALAAESHFDLIFLDVLMPGIDGFTTCKGIHNTALNRHTPVVFITSRDDTQAHSQAVESGGCGLIPKPVLASQITLTALTFILLARFTQPKSPALPEAAACLVEA